MYLIFGRKTIAAVLSAAVLLTAAAVTSAGRFAGGASVPTEGEISWGLNYDEENEPPIGAESTEQLEKMGAYYTGDTTKKRIYLTFDAGYENGQTAHILDVLKKQEAPAVFFLVGNYLNTQPELVRRMVSEGHTVGNHTMTHPDMTLKSGEDFDKELLELEELYEKTTGEKMKKFFRPPQGKYTRSNLLRAQSLGYTTVLWSLAYADWDRENQPTKEAAFDKLLPRIHNGAVILLHSTSTTNSLILDELLTKYKEMGYTFGDISELTKQ